MTLPLVLLGPLVRRVEARVCAFCMAFRDEATVTVTIWPGIQQAGATAGAVASGDPVLSSASARTRNFGEKLHVAVVSVKLEPPTPPLTPGALYSYDVSFSGAFGSESLRSVGLLSDEPDPGPERAGNLALGYADQRLPSFVAPVAAVDAIRIAHASCRKASGPGYDALAWLDDVLALTFTDSTQRPQALVLTGDQIYADDLPSSLLWMIGDLAEELLGGPETLRIGASDVPVTRVNFPPERRRKFVRTEAGFTTSDGQNHLLSFGEFAAMYLLAWNPRIWRALGSSEDVFVPFAGDPALAGKLDRPEDAFGGDVKDWAKAAQGKFDEERAAAELYRLGVPKVARALANIATYMIFDDHEVTDDWNLSRKWQNRVYSRDPGRDVVRNAVMAYGLFQGWGNDPIRFESGNNKELLDESERLFPKSGPYPVAPFDRIRELTGTAGAPANRLPVWSYQVSGPRHTIAVCDTRTRRKFAGQGHSPPSLLGDELDSQVPAGPFVDGRELLFVVSPAPVLGPELIESLAWPLAVVLHDVKSFGRGLEEAGPGAPEVGFEKFDVEGWAANERAREALLKRLSTHPRAVILSGDVHYGCSLTLDYWKRGAAAPSRIVQLTCSPARNVFKEQVASLVRTNELLQRYESGFGAELLGWDQPPPLTFPSEAIVSPGRRARLRRAPTLVPSRGWPPETMLPAGNAPDWSWRALLVRDERPDSEFPTPRRPLDLAPSSEVTAGAALPAYGHVAARHQQAALTHFDHRRQIVFAPNLGFVRVWLSGSELMLTHALLSEDAPDSKVGAQNTRHEISLAASSEAAPTVVPRSA